MESNNPFKKIEPSNEEPRAQLKKMVMRRIGLNEVLADILGLFTFNFGRSVKDVLDIDYAESDQNED